MRYHVNLFVLFCLALFCSIFTAALWMGIIDGAPLVEASLLTVFVIGIGFFSWIKLSGSRFDLFIVIGIAQIMFSCSQFILFGLGIIERRELLTIGTMASASDKDLLYGCVLAMTSMSFYFFGGGIAAVSSSNKEMAKVFLLENAMRSKHSSFLLHFGLMCVGIGLVPYIIYEGGNLYLAATSGYFSMYEQGIYYQGVAATLSILFEPGLVVLLIWAALRGKVRLRNCIMMFGIALALTAFVLGQRGDSLSLGAALIMVQHRLWKPLQRKKVILFIPILLVSIYLVGMTRGITEKRFSNIFDVMQVNTESLLLEPIMEMGGSARTIISTVKLVPKYRDYDYGGGYFAAIMTAVPNIFVQGKHPFADQAQYGSWLTSEIAPTTHRLGGSVGFSNVAESYINFGSYGCVIFLFYGFFLARISIQSRAVRSFKLVLVESILILLLPVWARGSMISIARSTFFFVVFPLWILSLKKGRLGNPELKRIRVDGV